MRLNQFLALHTSLSRRSADKEIALGKVTVNNAPASLGTSIEAGDTVVYNGDTIPWVKTHTTIMFHKPVGYVCSRNGQGSKTIYDLLPTQYHELNSIGRLDKDSSGLLLLTNDGQLANELSHPRYQKRKVYEVSLDKPLSPLHHQMLVDIGISLDDGVSKFAELKTLNENRTAWMVVIREGRNRQIRRTFYTLGYDVLTLYRTEFGDYHLGKLSAGDVSVVSESEPTS